MPGVREIAGALAEALAELDPTGEMTIEPRMLFAPNPPALDIYPATPAETNLTFGPASRTHWWTVRLRTATSDADGQQDFLLDARDPTGAQSVRAAIIAACDPGGALFELGCDAVTIDDNSPSGFRLYEDVGAAGAVRYLGEEWRVGVMASEDGTT